MTREIGCIMTAIVMAGRTGAAFAAQLGTMNTNQEIDALSTMGISPMEFLVLPRMLALIVMMPLLTIYADLVGILGGAVVGVGMLGLGPIEYFEQTRGAVSLTELLHRRQQERGVRRPGRARRLPPGYAVGAERRRRRARRHLGRGHVHRAHHRHRRHLRGDPECPPPLAPRRPAPRRPLRITVADLTMAYGSFVIQHDLSFTIARGEIFVIMGGSGCGKSTLLNHMVGLLHPGQGRRPLRRPELLARRRTRSATASVAGSACPTRPGRSGAR